MENLVRREVVQSARTIVVKVGTNVLSRDDDTLDVDRIHSLADQLHRIRQTGRNVVLVSSGAVGAGIGLLKLPKRPDNLPELQAAAATGQAHLMRLYNESFQRHGYHAAQILLTANDFKSRARYLNVRNTINTLFEFGCVPVINENDTVSIAEIKFGDNDRLAAMVSHLVNEPLLIILSIVNGLYNGDPRDPNSRPIPLVENVDDDIAALAADIKSKRGTGGMKSKLEAVRTATAVGECVIIADGTIPNVLDRLLTCEELGTLFLAKGSALPAWKRWIGFTIAPKGKFRLDDGAIRAIEQQGRSLLSIGIQGVEGDFSKGEVVSLVDGSGREVARGLSNYGARDAASIAGKRTADVQQILGARTYAEVIHRDNLVVTR